MKLLLPIPCRSCEGFSHFEYLAYLWTIERADERTRTADLVYLRVIYQALQGCAGGFNSRISMPVFVLCLAFAPVLSLSRRAASKDLAPRPTRRSSPSPVARCRAHSVRSAPPGLAGRCCVPSRPSVLVPTRYHRSLKRQEGEVVLLLPIMSDGATPSDMRVLPTATA